MSSEFIGPDPRQSAIDIVRAKRASESEKKRAGEEVKQAIPEVRARIFNVIRQHTQPYEIPSDDERLEGCRSILSKGVIYLVRGDEFVYEVSPVELNFEIPIEGEEDPLRISISASSYPKPEDPEEENDFIDISVYNYELGLYKTRRYDEGVISTAEDYHWIDGETETLGTRAISTDFSVEDIGHLHELLELAENATPTGHSTYRLFPIL